jgi:hypothetical protein
MSRLINAIRMFFQRLVAWIKGPMTFADSSRTELTTDSPDPIAIQFCHDVNKASQLLDFLIEEGHPYHIPDEIIRKIEDARGRVKQPALPTAEERAELLKAYRDLVAIPGSAVLFDFPPTPFWQSRWRAGLMLTAIFLPAVSWVIIGALFRTHWWGYWYWPIAISIASALLIWGLYVLIGIVSNRKLNHLIAFCYSFTLLILVCSLAPWWIPKPFSGTVSTAPVSLLRGCADQGTESDVPKGVACNKAGEIDGYQWVLNIGGVVGEPRTQPASDARPTQVMANMAKPPPNAAPPPATPAPPPANPPHPPANPAAKAESNSENAAPQPASEVERQLIYVIHGGLVVPLYVIVLSLIGGAVSMTRRVPEYQRRAMSSQDALSNQQARESLVFQIMQVVSAPLIAVAAYYIVNPSSRLTSVVLGFGSGFASEPILLMIRGLVEKLSPTGSPSAAPVSVRVEPPSKELEPGKPQQFAAHVTGASTSEVTWLIVPSDAGSITQSGFYTAPKEEGKAVTITACSVADRTKCGNASVITKIPLSVRVEPSTKELEAGKSQQFVAHVTGASTSEVTWLIVPPDAGSITQSGLYAAPNEAGKTVTITARSVADRTKSGSASVTTKA